MGLFELLRHLRKTCYHFITPTPKTHATVLAREPGREANTIVEVLGWSRPFRSGSIDQNIEVLLERAEVVESVGEQKRATVRVATLGGNLFLHSAFPTTAADSVFFGPDSYRFARFVQEQLAGASAQSIVDIGTGSGVGAVVAATLLPLATVAMTDVNRAALRFARINAAAAGFTPSLHCGDILADVSSPIDVAIANPPYIIDEAKRAYRDGGGLHGAELSLRMANAVLPRLKPGGRFLLYTGSAIIRGKDHFLESVRNAAAAASCKLTYYEIDPDVFGEELEQAAYADVDRIAVVGAAFVRI